MWITLCLACVAPELQTAENLTGAPFVNFRGESHLREPEEGCTYPELQIPAILNVWY